MFIKAGTALFVTGLLLLPAAAVEVAGSIDYQFGDRPSDVSADFKATPRAALRFLPFCLGPGLRWLAWGYRCGKIPRQARPSWLLQRGYLPCRRCSGGCCATETGGIE